MKSIYENRAGTDEEIAFQKAYKYLLGRSLYAIGNNVKNKSILDVGSGGLRNLGLALEKRCAIYTGFDKDDGFLEKLRESNLSTILGNILSSPFEGKLFDIAHARILLMHMSKEDLPIAIKNILSLVRERAIFLELDWTAFRIGGPITEKFRDFCLELMGEFGDPFIGSKLLSYVGEIAYKTDNVKKVAHNRFSREAGSYYYEIIPLVKMMVKIMGQMNHKLLGRGQEILKMITKESKGDDPEKFGPPDVRYVEVIF